MNLVNGEILDTKTCDGILAELDARILKTLQKDRLRPETVISACDRMIANMDESAYLDAMEGLGIDPGLGKSYIEEAKQMFSGESLRRRMSVELGPDWNAPVAFPLPSRNSRVIQELHPLGTLLHIAAGNSDGLPAFSVLEGLLTGNINILKLPAAEGGISVRLLLELIREEPSLAEYIYVFDYSSRDIEHIELLVSVADAVVVWGGAEAVGALRCLVPPNIRLIEWGHKISFGYVTTKGLTDEGLAGFAKNIAETGQLLCSSVQGIFVDTDDMEEVYAVCERLLPLLEDALGGHKPDIGIRTQSALQLYNQELEGIYSPRRIFKGQNCSLIAYPDPVLDTSIQFGNAWVRPLPREKILPTLHPYKNFLQTVGLCCTEEERSELAELFFRAGAVRVCPGESMSTAYVGAPHDGEYPLRRYTKVVNLEQ